MGVIRCSRPLLSSPGHLPGSGRAFEFTCFKRRSYQKLTVANAPQTGSAAVDLRYWVVILLWLIHAPAEAVTSR